MSDSQAAIPEGWNKVKLQDLVFLDREKLTEGTNADFSFYYIDITSVSESFIQFPSTKIAFRGSPSRARKVVHSGDVLMATVRPNLKAFAFFDRTDDNCIASTGFAVLTAKQDVDPRFVLYSILSDAVSAQVEAHVVGSNYPAINSKDIRRLKILAPPPHEQRKIARILTTLDNLIKKTEALIAKYQAIKQGMMHDLFTRGVDAHGHLRPKQSNAPDLYKQSELGWIPKEWALSCVADEFHLSTGFTLGLHRRPKLNVKRYLRVANVQRDEILLDDIAELEATDEEFETRRLDPNDLLVVEGHADPGQIGRCAIVTHESAGLTFQNHLFRLRSRKVLPRFACDWLNSEIARRYWLCRCATSSGLNTINQTMLKKMPFLVPQPNEQEEIAARSVAQSASIKTMEFSLFKFRQTKAGLMQDLLTGSVRVKVDESEEAPAHA